jgi:hypothetical protein
MSVGGDPGSGGSEDPPRGGAAGEPSEAELRAAWEEQLRLLTPADVIVQTAVSLISLAGRRLGLEPGTEGERDLGQVRDGIDGVRALLPVLERGEAGPTLAPLREAVSALQFEYAKLAGAPPAPAQRGPAGGTEAPSADRPASPANAPAPSAAQAGEGAGGEPGPAQRSGRLWVPGS